MNAAKKKNVFSWLMAVVLGGTALMISGCTPPAPAGDPAIIGKWAIDGREIFEFRADGTWIPAKKEPEVVSTKWMWDGTNYVRLIHKTTDKEMPTATESYRVRIQENGNALILNGREGDTLYSRMK